MKKKRRADKPKLLLMASSRTRRDPRGPLLRFVRDHARVLKKFEIHATRGTCKSILATGMYTLDEVTGHRSGPEGGVVELAAMVAKLDCLVFIFLSDPMDRVSDVPENRALQRLCKELNVRLINTLAGAEQWALYEADLAIDEWNKEPKRPVQIVRERKTNIDEHGEPTYPDFDQQTLALISHDAKKDEMVAFVNDHHEFLRHFHCILTTGTTGYLIKLLFADKRHVKGIEREAYGVLKNSPGRFEQLLQDVWLTRLLFCSPTERRLLLERAGGVFIEGNTDLKKKLKQKEAKWDSSHDAPRPVLTGPDQNFVDLIMPLASGPKGGDVLIAEEVLNNHCHAVVFFQDPGTAQPHEPDIRLFERTCQFWPKDDLDASSAGSSKGRPAHRSSKDKKVRQTYATCVSDFQSANKWAEHMMKVVLSPVRERPLAHILRENYGLKDVVIVDGESEEDTLELGQALARACAGYLHRCILTMAREGEKTRIGIGYGWTPLEVLNQLIQMRDEQLKQMRGEGLVDEKSRPKGKIVWSTLVANLPYLFTEREASVIVHRFQKFYGTGEIEWFRASGIIKTGSSATTLLDDDLELIANLSCADLIITSGAPWNPDADVARLLNPEAISEFNDAVGTVSLIPLDRKGKEVQGKVSQIGLGYEGFQRAAKRGAVILICGGKARNEVALAALKGNLVSVLVTTRGTAQHLLKPPGRSKLTARPRPDHYNQ